MAPASLLWLGMAMAVFIAANSTLRTYAASSWWPALLVALLLFSVGNVMMVRLMRESGLALPIALSSVAQLVLLTLVAVAWFGERPTGMQWAGLGLGVVAVALIAWPRGSS